MSGPTTLVVDIGGSSVRAAVLDAAGRCHPGARRVPTPYPLDPGLLETVLHDLAGELPCTDRASIGFPGVVRDGRVRRAPEFVAVAGLGSPISPELTVAWAGYDLAGALAVRLDRPVRVVNDADLLGLGVARGPGLELVATLGTGFGTALLDGGVLCPHLELAHAPFRDGQTFNQQVGDAARREVGDQEWSHRVRHALEVVHDLVGYDQGWVLGGNTQRLTMDLAPWATVVEASAGMAGGVRLWAGPSMSLR